MEQILIAFIICIVISIVLILPLYVFLKFIQLLFKSSSASNSPRNNSKTRIVPYENLIQKKGNKFYISIPIFFIKVQGSNTIFADCPGLGLSSYGKNLEDAIAIFDKVASQWNKDINNTLISNPADVLRNLGWEISKSSITPNKDFCNIPANFIATRQKTITIEILD
jgi:hypothetical protein